jgi:hypothetical protein
MAVLVFERDRCNLIHPHVPAKTAEFALYCHGV